MNKITPIQGKGHRRGRTQEGKPNPIDAHVGGRVRLRRTLLGISQEKLGELIGLTFQQVQKYERGTNRISASRLFDLSRVLDVPMSFFFDDMSEDTASLSPRQIAGVTAEPAPLDAADPLTKRETLQLVRSYYRISDPKVRQSLAAVIKAVAGPDDAEN